MHGPEDTNRQYGVGQGRVQGKTGPMRRKGMLTLLISALDGRNERVNHQ